MSKEMRQAADQIDDGEVSRVEAIVRSMTPAERADPGLIDGSRRVRIARGSGTGTQEVNQLLKQFREMQKMMKGMAGGGMPAMPGMPGMPGGGGRLGGLRNARKQLEAMQAMEGQGIDGGLAELFGGQAGGAAGGAASPWAAPAGGRPVTGAPAGGGKGGRGGKKKKKGGRVTPPKPR
jgi:signal recognition particle subunit SRP54